MNKSNNPIPSDARAGSELEALLHRLAEAHRAVQTHLAGAGQPPSDGSDLDRILELSEQMRHGIAEDPSFILDALPAHIALLDSNGVILTVNESWRRFAVANVLGDQAFGVGQNYLALCERVSGDCAEQSLTAAAGIRQVLKGEATEFAIEYPCHSPERLRWFRLMVTPLRQDRAAGAVVMHVDVSDRKLAEAKIQRLSRLYEVSSGINEAIVRIPHEKALYEEACRIAVEKGGLRMAWVGLHAAGQTSLEPAARWGDEATYLDRVEVSVAANEPSGKGPAGQAFRTGRPARCNNIEAEKELFASRDQTLLHGFKSCAAFPLKLGGVTAGVFVVYAGQPSYFDDEEMSLLTALAENLSFAIEALEKEFESRRAATALRASEANMAVAQRLAHFGSWEQDLSTTVTPGLSALRWSDEMFRIAGYEPGGVQVTTELFFALVHPDDQELVRRAVTEAIRDHKPYSAVHRLLRADGVERIIRETAEVHFDADGRVPLKLVGTAHDITEHRRAEMALVESEERFRATFEQAAVGIVHVAPNGRFLRVNSKLCEITGFSQEELLGMSFADLTLPEDFSAGDEARRSMLSGERTSYSTQKRYHRKSGHFFWANLVSTLVREPTGEPKYFISVIEDITERQLADFRLQRLNRLYAVLSGINEAIVRSRKREELFEAACRIAVEQGLLRMVFVAEKDAQTSSVRPVASFGATGDYLKDLFIIADDSPNGKGTVGTAIRTGAYDVSNDIETDPRMAPWRKSALEHGFRATATFPIKVDGTTIGGLVLFASEVGFFQEEEIVLMVAITRAISFALEAMDEEQQKLRAEEALKASENRYRNLVESSHDLIWSLDSMGLITFLNQAGCEAFGRDREEMIGRPLAHFVPQDQIQKREHIYKNALLTGVDTVEYESQIQRKDGSLAILSTNARIMRDNEGRVTGSTGISRDVTGQKRQEQHTSALSELGWRLNTAKSAHEAAETIAGVAEKLFKWDALTLDLYNANEDRITALLTVDTIDGSKVDCVPAYDLQPPSTLARRVVTEGPMLMLRDRLETAHPDGLAFGDTSRRSASLMFVPVLDGSKVIGIFSVQSYRFQAYSKEDLGTLKTLADYCGGALNRIQAEQERQTSDERYQLAVRGSSAGLWDWNLLTNDVYYTPRFKELLGYAEGEFPPLFSSMADAIHPEDKEMANRALEAHFSPTRTPYDVEYRLRTKPGGYRWFSARGQALWDNDGKAYRMAGSITDITERKTLEQQFLRAQRMESIGTLAGGIAHDLNNVLTPIMMSIDLLKMDEADKGKLETLATIEYSARRGADMVRQVLSFARGVDVQRLNVPLHPLLHDIEKICNETFLKNIQVRVVIPSNLWTVSGDPTQLHQVLLNLCVNARDAMPNGGVLTLSAENTTLSPHRAEPNPEAKPGPYTIIQVEDNGTGMSSGVVEKIFDPFFTTKELGKGTGLGLSTTLAIVRSHGGFIRVYSEPGHGTKFRVYLPATPDSLQDVKQHEEAELPRGDGELVLVVDDEASVRQITRQTLEAFGYRVVLASDGAEAVAVYANRWTEIALVLTDMMMPVMDGPTTIRVLLRLNPKARIIAASGLNANGGVAKAANAGVKHFLPKPYTAETILKTFRQVLHPPAEPS